MDTTGNGATNPLEESVSGIAAPTPVTNSAAASLEVDGLAGRLRAELEQAQVAMEDMNDRIVELARASMAIEELQIMQEELQAAHDELGQRNQGYSSNEASAAVTK
jgi:hypothetical protein